MTDKPDLTTVAESDLLAELKRRTERKASAPKPLQDIDFGPLVKMIIDGINEAVTKEYLDDDFKHYVYECAIGCVYGSAFWGWRGQQKW